MIGLRERAMSDSQAHVGRPRINGEQTPARFPDGTLARIDATLSAGEKRSDFIREAVENELARRERAARRPSFGRESALPGMLKPTPPVDMKVTMVDEKKAKTRTKIAK